MRRIKRSATFTQEFQSLLAQGVPKFGYRLIAQKRDLVEDFVTSFLVDFLAPVAWTTTSACIPTTSLKHPL
jgi:hypothetical protein